jgi:hypothetical protein
MQPPWHFTTWLDLFDHWQTLAAGILAVLAATGTIWATIRSASREISASQAQTAVAQQQIATTIRLERRRVAREDIAFHAMFEAAMGRVLADATAARKEFPGGPGPDLGARAYAARKSFSKAAFNELRGASVSHGSRLTEKFLELESKIDVFASKTYETSIAGRSQPIGTGDPNDLPGELDVIEAKAAHLREEAAGEMKQAQAVIAETEPPIPTPPKRSWLLWRARPTA